MFLTPFAVIGVWFRGILAIAILAGGIWLVREWYNELPSTDAFARARAAPQGRFLDETDVDKEPFKEVTPERDGVDANNGTVSSLTPIERIGAWRPAYDRKTNMLLLGSVLLLLSVAGRSLRPSIFWAAKSEPFPHKPVHTSHQIDRPDGTKLHIEVYGHVQDPTIVVTHGWAMNREEWIHFVANFSDKFRVIAWDLPGLGKSTRPLNNDFSLEKLASDLRSVVEFSGVKPVTLIGHSIGGMTILTLCRLFPELLKTRVSKMVLVHTTYTNPIRTASMSALYTAIEKPVIVPLLYLQIALSPLVWIMTWMSYWNGSVHRSTMRNGFSIRVSNSKLNYIASFSPKASPAVLARGGLGMLSYDATQTLPTITVPVLIVAAASDPLTTPQASHYMASNIPGAKLITLEPAKHFGLVEHDLEFAKEVGEFVQ